MGKVRNVVSHESENVQSYMDRAIGGRKYCSPAQLEGVYPYSDDSWRMWFYTGRLRGCLKPGGKRGRLLIPIDEAERVMREGPDPPGTNPYPRTSSRR